MRGFLTLLSALVYRDIIQRYKRSLLGPAWAILQPVILMVIFNLLHKIVNISSDGMPYLVFSYSALVPWTFFTNAVMFCGPSALQNAAIIKKSSVPREVFPLSAVIVALFDFLMSFTVLLAIMLWFGVKFSWLMLWVFPLVIMTAVLAFSVGLAIAVLGTFKRDFIFASPFLMQFWMFLSPVIYPLSLVPAKWKGLYLVNPMAGIVESFRGVLIKASAPTLEMLAPALISITVVFGITVFIYRFFSRYFADIV